MKTNITELYFSKSSNCFCARSITKLRAIGANFRESGMLFDREVVKFVLLRKRMKNKISITVFLVKVTYFCA